MTPKMPGAGSFVAGEAGVVLILSFGTRASDLTLLGIGQRRQGDMPKQIAQLKRFDTLHSQHERELTPVVNVVGYNAPDRPLPGNSIHVTVPDMAVGFRQIVHRPLLEGAGNHSPGDF